MRGFGGTGAAAFGLMVASGFAGLGYQIVWTQQGTVWLGHEAAAVLAVVAAFFGGMGLGALLLGPRIERGARPAHWYAGCEAVIGVWSLVLALAIEPAARVLLGLTGPEPSATWQWSVAFVGTFVLLLPATAAMGATLPAMARVFAARSGRGPALGALYAANTFGAVLGVLATAFWLVPGLGLWRTAALCAVLNALCALLALRLFGADDSAVRAASAPTSSAPATDGRAARHAALRLAATGLLGIGYEVAVVRVLSQVAENTVYTFAMLLAVYLVGTALGAAAFARWRAGVGAERADGAATGRGLMAALGAACLLGTASLWGAEAVTAWLRDALGANMPAALAAEAAVAVLAFLLPTAAMGAVFSHLCQAAQAAGMHFGRALGINTVAAAAAPVLVGVWLLPALGPKGALLWLVAGYLALAWTRPRGAPLVAALAGATGVLALWAPPLAFVQVPEGGRVLSYRDGRTAAVSVVEDADGVRRLRIDNRQQEGSNAATLADSRQALLPLLLHPAPRRALFLGLGTGVTASAAAADPTLHVQAVELLPEVIDAAPYFKPADAAPPRLAVTAADARRYVRASSGRHDLIVSDNFHPARAGSAALYTVEHFGAVRERLADGGLFCQWLPLHQLDLPTTRSIVRSFLAAFPGGFAMLATNSLDTPVIGLVGQRGATGFDPAALRARMAAAAPSLSPAAFALGDEWALLGSFIAGPASLARWTESAELNTDDRPVVAYRAPRITYAADSAPRDRLLALLAQLQVSPAELVGNRADTAWQARLAAYFRARGLYLQAGRNVQPSADVRRMLMQVREPLLAVLHTSPDFEPAYAPLRRMAQALAQTDAAAANALLSELAQVQAAWPQARNERAGDKRRPD